MLKTRVMTGAVLSVIIATVLIFSHIPWVLNVAVVALCMQAIYELYNATDLKGYKWLYWLSYAVAIILSFVTLPHYAYIITPLLVLTIIIFIELFVKVKEQKRVSPMLSIFLATIFIFFFKTMSYLRQLEGGIYLLGGAVLISVITDIGAYFVGKGVGKHKLAPDISPKKTIEGSIGGTLIATATLTIIAIILQSCGLFKINIGLTILYLVLASMVGQFGDLALSSIKRIVGIKDYGNLLPGHGGVLDRFDSMMFVFPFTYLFYILGGNIITIV